MKHHEQCAVLSIAVQLLEHGLYDLLVEGMDRLDKVGVEKRDKRRHDDLVRLCSTIILSQYASVNDTLQRLRLEMKIPLEDVDADLVIVNGAFPTKTKDTLNCSEITTDPTKGRQLQTKQSIGKAIIVCRERPFAYCSALTCRCRKSNTLVEHLILASQLHLLAATNAYAFTTFLNTLSSHLEVDTAEKSIQENWSLRTQSLFATASVLHILFHRYPPPLERISLDELMLDSVYKRRLYEESLRLMEVLSRLPTNTHAITTMHQQASSSSSSSSPSSSATTTQTIQSITTGYAVFLQASSINHACAANSSIRYTQVRRHQTPSASAASTTAVQSSLRDIFESLTIEVVTTMPVGVGSEITVCYGPLYPRHSLKQRRHVLHSQYRFHCLCIACCREDAEEVDQQPGRVSESTSALPIWSKNGPVERVKDLCRRLDVLREEALTLNVAFTASLQQQPSTTKASIDSKYDGTGRSPAQEVIFAELTQLEEALYQLGDDHFSSMSSGTSVQPLSHVLRILDRDSDDRAASSAFLSVLPYLRSFLKQPTGLSSSTTLHLLQTQLKQNSSTPIPDLTHRDDAEHAEASNEVWREFIQLLCMVLDLQAQILATVPLVVDSQVAGVGPHIQCRNSSDSNNESAIGLNVSSSPLYLRGAKRVSYAINVFLASGLYAADDVIIARERVKAASLYLAGGDHEKAYRRAQLAWTVLSYCVVESDGDAQECAQIMHCVEAMRRHKASGTRKGTVLVNSNRAKTSERSSV